MDITVGSAFVIWAEAEKYPYLPDLDNASAGKHEFNTDYLDFVSFSTDGLYKL